MEIPLSHLKELGYSLRRYYVDEFYNNNVSKLSTNNLVLDLGGNKIRKRGYFNIEEFGLTVFYANLVTEKSPDIQCDAGVLPIASNQFDVVICAELLEHVLNPEQIVREIYRILKPGGCLLLTVPFLFRIHGDPDDFGRYTDHYWQNLLTETKFTDFQINKQGSFYSVIADFVKQYASFQIHNNDFFSFIILKTWLIIQNFAMKKERNLQNEKNESFLASYTTGFGITAIK